MHLSKKCTITNYQKHLLFGRIMPWGLLILSFFPLVMFMYIGTYTRYFADDYFTAGFLLRFGFWKTQVLMYQAWKGSYLNTFLISLFELAGVSIVRWLPALSMFTWISGLFWAMRLIFRTQKISVGNVWIGVLANVIIFGTIKSFRNYSEVIFWQIGIIGYQVSIVIFILVVWFFLKRFFLSANRPLAKWEYGVLFIAFFLIGGASETWIIVQITLFILGLFSFMLMNKSPMRKDFFCTLFIGFLASCVSLFVIAKAPGVLHRDPDFAELSFSSLHYSLISSFIDVPLFLFEWFRDNTIIVAMLSLAGFLVGFYSRNTLRKREEKVVNLRLGIFLLFNAYILLWAGFFPAYTVFGYRPPDRAIFTSMFIFIWAYVLLMLFAGYLLNSFITPFMYKSIQIFMFVCLALSIYWLPVRNAYSLSKLVPGLRLYAQLWDERDEFLRQAGVQGLRDVVVQSLRRNSALHDLQELTIWMEGDIQLGDDHWINRAAARYYGLTSINGRR